MHRIVVDAMGGDHAPDEVVRGAAEASLALTSAEIILVGDAAALGRLLPGLRHDGARVRVHHAPAKVDMDEKPAEALAAKPEASIAVAADLVARGEGDALVSAGNTGASVLACARRWQLLPGVRRAALAHLVGLLILALVLAGRRPWLIVACVSAILLMQLYSYKPMRLSHRGGGEWLQGAGQFNFLSAMSDADWLAMKSKTWAPESTRKATYVTGTYLLPPLKRRRIDTLPSKDVIDVLRKIADHAPDIARKARQYA